MIVVFLIRLSVNLMQEIERAVVKLT